MLSTITSLDFRCLIPKHPKFSNPGKSKQMKVQLTKEGQQPQGATFVGQMGLGHFERGTSRDWRSRIGNKCMGNCKQSAEMDLPLDL